MTARGFWQLDGVPNAQLEGDLQQLLVAGAATEARVVAHLAEVETRRLHAVRGQSLWSYCQKCLGFSDYEAYARITAARIARRFPVVFEKLERRELHLTALCEARQYLTTENHLDLLRAIAHKTKPQIRKLLATQFPKPDIPTRIRKLPSRIGREDSSAPDGSLGASSASSGSRSLASTSHSSLEPLSATRYRLQLTIDETSKEKLDLARDLLSHANPSNDIAIVIERALDALIENLQKRRFGQTKRPCSAQPVTREAMSTEQPVTGTAKPDVEAINGPHPARGEAPARASPARRRRHIPNALLRQILARDGMRCTFTTAGGHRCDARHSLEIHHDDPWARGGADTLNNLRLLCREHNRLLAERDYGISHVANAIERTRNSK